MSSPRPYALAVLLLVTVSACSSSGDRHGGSAGPPAPAASHSLLTSAPAPLTACAALRVHPGPALSSMSQEEGVIFAIRNDGPRTCVISGYPTVALRAGSHDLDVTYEDGDSQFVTAAKPRPVTLAPHGGAYFLVAKDQCTLITASVAGRARITLPGQQASVAAAATDGSHGDVLTHCTGPGSAGENVVSISPVEPTIARVIARTSE